MRKLSVLVIHNQYQQPGGEDAVVRAELEMLRSAGHPVVPFIRSNTAIAEFNPLQKASLAVSTTWNRRAHAQIRELIAKERPDIAHCHNLVPLISPAAYNACRTAGLPVVQTLHNYRLLCPSATLYSGGRICEDCGRSPFRGVSRGCYRNSGLQTAALAMMLGTHRLLRTWSRSVDAYVALSQFTRDCFVATGLPAEKLHIKPNFLLDDAPPRAGLGEYALYVGRLAPEKGVLEMLLAWQRLAHIPLMVVGDGPLRDEASRMMDKSRSPRVRLLGQLSADNVRAWMKNARFLVFPSRWYEPFGMTLLEAAACGVPAVAARVGAIPELVSEGQTGLLFDSQNPDELAAKANWAWTHPAEMAAMGFAARRLYEQKYTPARNYELLMNIYQAALSRAQHGDISDTRLLARSQGVSLSCNSR
ncbi:MAG: glycosyltransferase family 4 protein [Candidatus Korobacteraceae bacterium]